MLSPTPPKFFIRFFKCFCDPQLHPYIEGDLIELYEERVQEINKEKADRKFAIDVIKLFRPGIIRPLRISSHIFNQNFMFKNYMKIAWRNLWKQKLYSFINISGLTIGLSCFILIALYLQYELSYDTQHENADDIYRIIQQQEGNVFRGTDYFAVAPEPLAPAMIKNFPEVKAAATLTEPRYASDKIILAFEEKILSPIPLYADKNIFEIFTIPMIEGEGGSILEDPNSILLSQSLAIKYFGKESAIGKTLIFNKDRPLTVKGIFEDRPQNQHLFFDYLISLKNYRFLQEDIGRWNSNNYRTYVKLKEGSNYKRLEKKMEIFDKQLANNGNPFPTKFHLQPIQKIHLHSKVNFESSATSDIRYIYLFASIAFIILLLAAINYMNLATASSINRSKEVGMRKVMGARKGQLVTQLLGESFLLTFISFLLAFALVYSLLPLFRKLMGHPLSFEILGNSWFLIGMLLMGLLIGGLSGLYPALFLSSVPSIKAIKGTFLKKFGKGNILRNFLIVGQSTAAIILAISSVLIYQQLNYIQNKKLGYNREQVLYVPFYFEDINNNYNILRQNLLENPQITKVASSRNLPLNTNNQGMVDRWEGNAEERSIFCYRNFVDYHFLDLYEMELVAGRNFSLAYSVDSTSSYILNESAVDAIGWTPEEALGKGFRNGRVIGVVKNFHFLPMDLKIEPLSMVMRSPQNSYDNYGNISIKVNTDNIDQSIAHIQKSFKDIAPNLPFEYHFVDDSYNQLYESEQRLSKAFNIFTFLAIFIALVGLFGLISHSVVQRSKEIGIRKVLGASALSIIRLISKDFLRLVGIAVIIAILLSWYLMGQWLQGFAFRIEMSWWLFLLIGLLAVALAFITVSLQSFKAASKNPIDTLQQQ